jgi:hypothetical protein
MKSYGDNQESFLFSETLKYLFLIFDDGTAEWHVSDAGKNKWVFNTEAHPLRVKGWKDLKTNQAPLAERHKVLDTSGYQTATFTYFELEIQKKPGNRKRIYRLRTHYIAATATVYL